MAQILETYSPRDRLFEFLRQADVVLRTGDDTSSRAPTAREAAQFIETAQHSWR